MKVGLVLSGGSIRGICAHTGMLKALIEAKIYPTIIMGTSAGAIAGSLYASGRSPDEMTQLLSEIKKNDYVDINKWKLLWKAIRLGKGLTGMSTGDHLEAWLDRHMAFKTFEEAIVPIEICATNISRGCPEILSSGSMVQAARASSAIPFFFEPQEINGQFYVDGGAVNNIPLDEMIERHPDMDCYIVSTALSLNKPIPPADNKFLDKVGTPLVLLRRILDAVSMEQFDDNIDYGDKIVFFVKTNPGDIGLDNPSGAADRVNEAYQQAKEIISKIEWPK